jgi:hypothetical protein
MMWNSIELEKTVDCDGNGCLMALQNVVVLVRYLSFSYSLESQCYGWSLLIRSNRWFDLKETDENFSEWKDCSIVSSSVSYFTVCSSSSSSSLLSHLLSGDQARTNRQSIPFFTVQMHQEIWETHWKQQHI